MNRIVFILFFVSATYLMSAQTTEIKPLPERITLSPITDIDGNSYPVIRIGTQVWMAAHLKTQRLWDGTPLTNRAGLETFSSEEPSYCYLDNQRDLGLTLGFLYNYAVVNTGKICPKGWHVPSNTEWKVLEEYLVSNGYGYTGKPGNIGIAKALASTVMWNFTSAIGCPGSTDYPGRRNATGFNALPSSRRGCTGPQYDLPNQSAYWWTSTQNGITDRLGGVWIKYIWYNHYALRTESRSAYDGYSIRCIRD